MKRMLPLKARKPHIYATRRLVAGDEYEAPVEQAIALVAERKADFAKPKPRQQTAAPPVEPPPEASPQSEIDRLRQQASELGIEVDGRWGVVRLRYEIAQVTTWT